MLRKDQYNLFEAIDSVMREDTTDTEEEKKRKRRAARRRRLLARKGAAKARTIINRINPNFS